MMHRTNGSTWAVLALTLASASALGQREEVDDAGRGALVIDNTQTFIDFQEVSLEELLGEGAPRLRFSANLFGNLGLSLGQGAPSGASANFYKGPLGLLTTANLGDRFNALAEINFLGAGAALHRFWMRYRTDRLYVMAGRDHTNVGYWNPAYHHGTWLQLTVDRPRFLALAAPQIFPIHTEGLEAGASLPVGAGKLQLAVGLNNGRELEGPALAIADKAVFLTAFFEQRSDLRRVRLGLSAFFDQLAALGAGRRPVLPTTAINESLFNVHAVYLGQRLTVIAEAYALTHALTASDGRTFTIGDAYALVGYRFGRATPYLRLEYLDVRGDGFDPVYVPVQPIDVAYPAHLTAVSEGVGGVRYDLTRWCALKAEYRLGRPLRGGRTQHAGFVDWSFGL